MKITSCCLWPIEYDSSVCPLSFKSVFSFTFIFALLHAC